MKHSPQASFIQNQFTCKRWAYYFFRILKIQFSKTNLPAPPPPKTPEIILKNSSSWFFFFFFRQAGKNAFVPFIWGFSSA